MAEIKNYNNQIQEQNALLDKRYHLYLKTYQEQHNKLHPVYTIALLLARSLAQQQELKKEEHPLKEEIGAKHD